jgi:hypothetical protein
MYNLKNLSDREFKELMTKIHEEIKVAAYYKWEQAGCPLDEDAQHQFWLDAEREAFIKIGLITP